MACACKVNTQINKIQEKYGVSKPTVKTNIKGQISIFFKNLLLLLMCLPLCPLILLYIIVRKCFTNKPISISRFIKLKKNVRI